MTHPRHLSMFCGVLLATFANAGQAAAPAFDSTYTSIASAHCRNITVDEESSSVTQRCPAFRNIGVLLLEGDLRQSLTLVMNRQQYPLNFWSTVTPAFSSFGDKIEWRHPKGQPGKPIGMIVRLYASENPEKPEETTSYLVVSKVTPKQSCVVGKVRPQADNSQNAKARVMAERAAGMKCLNGY